MAFLDGLKNLGILEEKTPPKGRGVPPVAAPSAPPPVVTFTPAPPPPPPNDNEMAAIAKALEGRELHEYDYLKFIRSVAGLEKVIPDEKTRFVTAFVTVQTAMNVSKDKISETSKHYLDVIEESLQGFLESLAKRTREQVEQGEASLASMDADLEMKRKQIAALQADIASCGQRRDDLAAKVGESKAQIERARTAYESACARSAAVIRDNVEKINRYIT